MQVLALLVGHAQQFLVTLTPEQATGLVNSCCTVGGLLLQYLSYRRGKKEQ
jgi:hypothetical protein